MPVPKFIHGATSLTGGGQGALDAIDGADLADLDPAIVIKLGYALFYSLDADSGAAESSPDVIAPDTNAGNKRWILTGISELTAAIMKQLKNIGAITISADQWGYLGGCTAQGGQLLANLDALLYQVLPKTITPSGTAVIDLTFDVGVSSSDEVGFALLFLACTFPSRADLSHHRFQRVSVTLEATGIAYGGDSFELIYSGANEGNWTNPTFVVSRPSSGVARITITNPGTGNHIFRGTVLTSARLTSATVT